MKRNRFTDIKILEKMQQYYWNEVCAGNCTDCVYINRVKCVPKALIDAIDLMKERVIYTRKLQ
jgi:uncharacterized cysteine cluster protein YcgN (CxxCxxCC family)